jgi:hypothetical protein
MFLLEGKFKLSRTETSNRRLVSTGIEGGAEMRFIASAMARSSSRTCCLLLIAMMLPCSAAAGTAAVSGDSRIPLRTSLCAALANPARFNGKKVKIHFKYSGTSEGNWLSDEHCTAIGDLVVPDQLREHSGVSDTVQDHGWQEFESASRRLYNGLLNRGDYDYVSADFTGILSIKRNFRVKNGFGNGWGHLGMSQFRLMLISVTNVVPHPCACPTSDSSPSAAEAPRR